LVLDMPLSPPPLPGLFLLGGEGGSGGTTRFG
jgi:hypothetical protein